MSATPSEPPPHLDLDALADVVAGEAGPASAAHLDACASCTSRLQELRAADAGVLAALSALPAPAAPADMADRLSAAFAAEPPPVRTAAQPPVRAAEQPPVRTADQPSASVSSVTPLPARGSVRRRRWLPAAAAAVLLVSGAGLGFSLLQGGDEGESADMASPAAGSAETEAADLDIPLSASGADWSAADVASTTLPQVLSRQALQDQSSTSRDTGQDDAGTLAEDGLAALRTTEGLSACLRSVLPPDQPGLVPLAVDYASYAGQPALAVVLPDPDPAQVSVFVVGAGCNAETDDTLFFLRAPRP